MPSLSNNPFIDKRDAQKGGYKASGLRMNQKIALKDSWGLPELRERNTELLKGIKDASLYEDEIRLVSIMRMDFELLEEIIEDLDESDSKIMKQYLLEGRLFKEIADDEGRTYEVIKKRMERIRAEIREEILECLEMNCRGGE